MFISFPVFAGRIGRYDFTFHYQRFASLARDLGNAFPVYLYSGFSFDYGYPVGIFYPDKFIYPFAWLIHFEWLTPLQTLQLYEACRNAAAILIAFYSFRRIFHSDRVALFGCVFYTASLWHLRRLYVTFALGEFTAAVFLPLLAAGLYDLRRLRAKSGISLFAAGYTGLIGTHIITTVFATYFIVAYVLIEWRAFFPRKTMRLLMAATGVTFLCNVNFIAPFVSWYQITYISALNYGSLLPIHDMSPVKFHNLAAGVKDLIYKSTLDQQLGAALLATFSCGITLAIYLHIRTVRKHCDENSIAAQIQTSAYRQFIITLLLSSISIWLSTRYFPWSFVGKHAPLFWIYAGYRVQFPWRYHVISVLLVALLAMQILSYLHTKAGEKNASSVWRDTTPWFITLVIFLTLLQGAYYIGRVIHELPPNKVPAKAAMDDTMSRLKGTRHPKASERITVPSNKKTVSISKTSRSGFTFTLRAKNTSRGPGWLDFPVWNYPGFKAISGKGDKLGVADGDNRRVRVYLPPRFNDTLTLRWAAPWHWRVAHWVSWISMAALLLFAFTPLPGWLVLILPRMCGFSPHRSAPW